MKIVWRNHSRRRLTLQAVVEYEHGAVTPTGLKSEHLDSVQEWCIQNKCGLRMSFDMFKFRNKAEISMFLLKWSQYEISV